MANIQLFPDYTLLIAPTVYNVLRMSLLQTINCGFDTQSHTYTNT